MPEKMLLLSLTCDHGDSGADLRFQEGVLTEIFTYVVIKSGR